MAITASPQNPGRIFATYSTVSNISNLLYLVVSIIVKGSLVPSIFGSPFSLR
jgi:hypothetical protein